MASESSQRIILVVLLMVFVTISASGTFFQEKVNHLLLGIAASVLAGVFLLIFLRNLDRGTETTLLRVEQALVSISDVSAEFNSVGRNTAMGDEFWVNLIEELGASRDPVYFLGNKLSRWREGAVYSPSLRKGLEQRLHAAAKHLSEDRNYETYIMVTSGKAADEWRRFLDEIVDKTLMHYSRRNKGSRDLIKSKLKVLLLSSESVKYSAVLCGDRLTVAPYTSAGRLEDSPTLDVRLGSVTRNLYKKDLDHLALEGEILTGTIG